MNCPCPGWQAAGELFLEAIGMIHIDYCPWCGEALAPTLTEDEFYNIPVEPVEEKDADNAG